MAENLWAISIDPDEAMREYVLLQLQVRAMRDLLFRSRIFTYLAAATPGPARAGHDRQDLGAAQPDRKVKKGRKYDLVIVDAPATGHGVGFLQTPRTFAEHRPRRPDPAPRPRRSRPFIGNHRKTGVAIVALPEEMPVNESATARARADRGGRRRGRPRLHERRSTPSASPTPRSSSGSTSACAPGNGGGARRACRAGAQRGAARQRQREQLARLARAGRAPP